VWRVWCNMGCSGSAFKNATFYPLPYGYRCPGAGRDIFVRNGTTSWTPTDNYFRLRATVWINILATGAQSVQHPSKDVNSIPSPTRWIDGANECSYEQYLWVFINHQHDDWVQCLPLAEFAANNGVSGTTKCTWFHTVQGMDPRMSFAGEPTKTPDQRRPNGDQVQATIQQIHEHLWVDMRRSQAVHEEGANRGWIPARISQESSQVWLDARHIRTTRPTRKLDWKCLRHFRVVCQISPYAYELELPASIRIHRVEPVSLLDSVVDDPLREQRIDPPPLVEVDGKEEHQVSSVFDSQIYRNEL